MKSFAAGFAGRTRFIIVAVALYILSGLGVVAGMLIAPNATAEFFPIWISAGAAIFVLVVLTFAVLSYRENRSARKDKVRAKERPRDGYSPARQRRLAYL